MEKSPVSLKNRSSSSEIVVDESRFQHLFMHMTEGFAHCKMIFRNGKPFDFIYLNVNPAFEKQTGLKDVVGRKVSEVIPGIRKSDPQIFEIYGRVALGGKPEKVETYVEALKMWFSVSVYSPQKEHFVAIFDVITERKKTEEALRESEDKFKYVFDNSSVGKSFTLPSGVIQVNKAFCKMLGYLLKELQEKKWQDITHPDDIELSQKEINALLSGKKKTVRFTKRYLHKNGSVVWTDVSSSLRRDKDGEPLYFITSIIDITKRKQAEENLTRSRQMLKLILDNIPQRVFWKGKDLKYLGCNQKLANDAGLKETSEIVGKDDFQLTWGKNAGKYRNDDLEVIAKGKAKLNFEETIEAKDGTFRWVRTNKLPLKNSGGDTFGVIGTYEDITERKETEKELELLARFPAENPNSIMRVSMENRLIFANKSSAPILKSWKIKLNDLVPKSIQKEIAIVVKTKKSKEMEFACGDLTFSFVLVAVPERGYLNMYGRDITERIQAVKALRESENQLSQIYNNVSDVIFVLAVEPNNNFRFISVNKRFLEVTGISEKQILGKPYQEVIPKPAQALVLGNYKKAILTKKTFQWEETSAYPTGTKIGEVYVTPVFDESGNCTQLVGMVHDITERRQAEETIRISETRYHNLIDSQSDIIARSDPKGILTFINDAYCKTFGKSREQLLGQSFVPAVFPEDRRISEEAIKKVKQPPYRSQSETRHITPEGLRWFSWENSAIVGAEGKVTELQSVGRDITKTKQAHLEFQQRNEDLALLAAINEALNRGESLTVIISLISAGFKRTFNGHGVSVFLPSTDRLKLVLQYIPVSPILLGRIEKLVGLSIVHLEFDFQKAHFFHRAIESRKPYLINDSVGLQKSLLAFAQAAIPNERTLAHVKNILPTLQKMVGLKSEIIVPLFSKNELVGVLEIGSRGLFTEEDLNRVAAFSGQLTAVIKRKSAEEALRKSEESFRNLFENSTVGLYRTTPDGKILLANPALVKMLGYESCEELANRNLEKDGFEPGYARHEFKKRVENDTFVQGLEIAWKKKDGTKIYVRESSKAIRDARGRVRYYEGTVEDITERKKAEQELAHSAQELQARNADLERFNKAAVGRELRMIELKKQINELSKKCDQPAPYSVSESVESRSRRSSNKK